MGTDGGDAFVGSLHELRNPITHSAVRFTQPFDYRTTAQREALIEAFNAWCLKMWDSVEVAGATGRCDPLLVDPNALWGGSDDLISDPQTAFNNAVDAVCAQFGVYMVGAELDRRRGR